jgi:hypothetical protein
MLMDDQFYTAAGTLFPNKQPPTVTAYMFDWSSGWKWFKRE